MFKSIINIFRRMTLMQLLAGLLLSAIVLPPFYWWRMSRAVDKMMFQGAEFVYPLYDIGYEDTFTRLNGEFGATDVEFDSLGENDEVLQTFHAERVTVRPPGMGWLLRRAGLFKSNTVPDRIELVLHNVRLLANPGREPFDFSALPYENAGCGEPFIEQEFVKLAGAIPKGEIGYSIESFDSSRSRVRMWVHSVGLARSEYAYDINLQRPVRFPELFTRLDNASIERMSIEYRDEGFIAKRNAYCAKKLGVAPDRLTDLLMEGLQAELLKDGVRYPQEMIAQVRRFQEKGGTLRIDTPAPVNLPYDYLNDETSSRLMSGVRLQVALDGETPISFQATPATAAAASAQPAVSSPAAALATPVPSAAAVPPPPLKTGEILDAARLPLAVGHMVEVTTRYGSTRTGELIEKPLLMVTLQLSLEEGGFKLTIPQSDITRIRFLRVKHPLRRHSSDNAPHAKTH